MRRPALALLVAFATALPACGGEDSDTFREGYNRAIEGLSAVSADIGLAAEGAGRRSNRAISREFNRIADSTERTRSRLSELEPPEDAKDEFDELLAQLETGVNDLRSVAAAARRDDPQAARRAVRALGRTSEEIAAAEDALKRAVDR